MNGPVKETFNETRKRSAVPPPLWSSGLIMFISICCGSAALFPSRDGANNSPFNEFLLLFYIALCLVVAVFFARHFRRRRHFRRLIDEHGYGLCASCGYVLTGSQADCQCPECGASFTRVELEAAWKEQGF